MPIIKRFSARPVGSVELGRMRTIQEHWNASAAYSAACVIGDRGKYIQGRLIEQSPKYGAAVLVKRWYPFTADYLMVAELSEQGVDFAELALNKASRMSFRGREVNLIDLRLTSEETVHSLVERLQRLLSQDLNRSGFSLVDYVLASPEFGQQFEDSSHPELARRLAELGAERYKRLHRAVTTGILT